MRFRCAQCRSLTQVQISARMTAPLVTACSGCGRKYRFAADQPRAAGDQERYRRAKEFAETNQIDLGSAYSVLEGVMTLAEAQKMMKGLPPPQPLQPRADIGAAATPEKDAPEPTGAPTVRTRGQGAAVPDTTATVRTAVVRPPTAPGTELSEMEFSYDPAFAAAVRDGCLTPQQALERGDRRALAQRLSQRHRLPVALALRVADNRLTVHQALQQKAVMEAKEPPRPQTSVSHAVWNFMIFSVGAMILGALGVHLYQVWGDYLARRNVAMLQAAPSAAATRAHVAAPTEAPAVPAPPPPMTVPKTDTTGQLVEVVGPDPRSVLISFCSTGRQSGRREPIEIAPTVPPDSSARWGVFRSLDNPSLQVRAILIRKDPRTGRWSVGDGRTPITTEAPPTRPEGTRPVPVSQAVGGTAPGIAPGSSS